MLPEELDERFILPMRRVALNRVPDEDGIVEEPKEFTVVAITHGAQQHCHRELALPIDPDVEKVLRVVGVMDGFP